jgi:hypothetical protein
VSLLQLLIVAAESTCSTTRPGMIYPKAMSSTTRHATKVDWASQHPLSQGKYYTTCAYFYVFLSGNEWRPLDFVIVWLQSHLQPSAILSQRMMLQLDPLIPAYPIHGDLMATVSSPTAPRRANSALQGHSHASPTPPWPNRRRPPPGLVVTLPPCPTAPVPASFA